MADAVLALILGSYRRKFVIKMTLSEDLLSEHKLYEMKVCIM